MNKCKDLSGYANYVALVRENMETMDKMAAVNQAIDECINTGNPISDFLRKHRAEVLNMTLTEYDEEKTMRLLREEAWDGGREEGRLDERKQLIKRMSKNMDVADIANATGVSVEEIEGFLTEATEA
jgi:predicted transposase YdaD